jgi:dUTPase
VGKGDRVAQLVLEKICLAEIIETDVRPFSAIRRAMKTDEQDLDATARGSGGFGSTGGFGKA